MSALAFAASLILSLAFVMLKELFSGARRQGPAEAAAAADAAVPCCRRPPHRSAPAAGSGRGGCRAIATAAAQPVASATSRQPGVH